MNFEFSEEQVMLRDSVARFVQDNYPLDTRRQIVAGESGYSADNWRTFAELGWLSIPFDERVGGFGGDAVDSMLIMQELGRGLVAEPFLPTVMLFGGLIQRAGSAAQQDAWLGKLIEGEIQGAFAFHEKQSHFELADVCTTATAQGEGYLVHGEKTVVFNGAAADLVVVSARSGGEQLDKQGISLFVVDCNAAGVSRQTFQLMDGQRVANIRFDNVAVAADARLGAEGEGFAAIQDVVNDAMLALAAEALGIMESLYATTVEYARTRQQFGVTIGSFQALQHRMVDMFMACEQAKSMLYRAVCSARERDDDSQRNLHALKVMIARAGKLVGDEAIQLHGGMGLTDELAVGHYVKRLMMINTTFGNGDYHQGKFNEISYN